MKLEKENLTFISQNLNGVQIPLDNNHYRGKEDHLHSVAFGLTCINKLQ